MSDQLLKELLESQQVIIKVLQQHSVQLEDLQKGQTRLETRVENEVIDKIRDLFDDRSMNQDYFASMKGSLARIEDRAEFLARQNIEHLNKLQNHDRELRLLRTEKK